MKALALSNDLQLPLKAATETFAFLGRRGSGKTYAAGKLVELLHGAGVQVVILDPVGTFWGLRLDADGKGPGLSIPVFGGGHGDVPLAASTGALVARALVEHESSAVLDVSHFRKGERKRFVQAFAEEFFHLKKEHRSPVHLVLEEAHVFAPQRPIKGEEPMLGAVEDLVRLGRNYGVGVSMLSQRAASVNKDVLTQCEVLCAFQTTSKQDRTAIVDWVEDKEASVDVVELSALDHECYLWSPGWLRTFKRLRVLPKTTFDASSTPEVGKTIKTRKLAPIDLDALRESMKAAVAEAEASDVASLRKRIRELEAQVATRPDPVVETKTKSVIQPVLPKEDLLRLERLVVKMDASGAKLAEGIESLDKLRDRLAQAQQAVVSESHNARRFATQVLADHLMSVNRTVAVSPTAMVAAAKAVEAAPKRAVKTVPGDARLEPAQQRILDNLHLMARLGVEATRESLAAWCGVHPNTKSFTNNLGALRSAGLLDGLRLTEAGAAAALVADVPTRSSLLAPLEPAARRIMEAVLANPQGLEREALGEALGVHPNTKSFTNNLGALRTRGFLVKTWPTRATDIFKGV